MKKPTLYNLTPARGQALLNFQGRIFPKTVELFETELVEEVRQGNKKAKLGPEKQSDLNSDFRNLLIHGDSLSACAYLKSKDIKVDLVYIDPPFASGANYAKKIYLRNGNKESLENENNSIGEEIMYGDIWQKEDYLNWLYERLLAIRDVLEEKGSIYLHLDWHIGDYARVLMDEVFGEENFKNEIIWGYRIQGVGKKMWARKHDVILYYTKSEDYSFVPEKEKLIYEKPFIDTKSEKAQLNKLAIKDIEVIKKMLDKRESLPDRYKERLFDKYYSDVYVRDVWDNDGTKPIISGSTEYLDFRTQKPEGLLQRIIKASSTEGMIIADFFSGSGTTAKAASDLTRKFIACDIGLNSIQIARDRLTKAGTEFDILKVKDGVRLFRNPAQTTAKIFSLIDGFKTRTDLGLGEFWDGGIVGIKGEYIPVKFIQIHDRLSKELLDVLLEEIYQLQDVAGTVSMAQVIYAHKDPDIDQSYINKEIKKAGKTTIAVELISIDELLGEKADKLFMPDNAEIKITDSNNGFKVSIKKFFSPYLKAKIDEYNSKKVKNTRQSSIGEETEKPYPNNKVSISDSGLELIEAVQFDTTLRKDGVWISNTDIEDKAGVKNKIKAVYQLPTKNFKMKIRNIAGDEIILDSKELI